MDGYEESCKVCGCGSVGHGLIAKQLLHTSDFIAQDYKIATSLAEARVCCNWSASHYHYREDEIEQPSDKAAKYAQHDQPTNISTDFHCLTM